jgi:hypothetical protein
MAPSTSEPASAFLPGGSRLTSLALDGNPYHRRADVEAEIASALQRSPWEWLTLVESGGTVSDETLVFLIKRAAKVDRDLCGRLIYVLSKRVASIATRWAQGFDPGTMEEVVLKVEMQIIELVLAEIPSRQNEILEIAFTQAVKRRTLNEVEKQNRAPLALRSRFRDMSDDGSDDDDPMERLEDQRPNPEEILARLADEKQRADMVSAARASVKDPRHLEAVILRHIRGWPITDKDPTKPSLERHFGKSGRQIQNWIKTALEAMHIAIGDQK